MTSDPTFWIAIASLVIGGIMLITGVISAAAIAEKQWWMWTLIILGTILSLIGSGLLIYVMSGSETEDLQSCEKKYVQKRVKKCVKKPKCQTVQQVVNVPNQRQVRFDYDEQVEYRPVKKENPIIVQYTQSNELPVMENLRYTQR